MKAQVAGLHSESAPLGCSCSEVGPIVAVLTGCQVLVLLLVVQAPRSKNHWPICKLHSP